MVRFEHWIVYFMDGFDEGLSFVMMKTEAFWTESCKFQDFYHEFIKNVYLRFSFSAALCTLTITLKI